MAGLIITLVWDCLFIYILEKEITSKKMIRQLFIFFLMVIFLSSCLKQSIADAMIADQDPGAKGVATLTYQINGNTVTTTVNGPDDQTSTDYQLICSKEPYMSTNYFLYGLDCLS